MEKIIDNTIEEEMYAGLYLLERYARLLLEDKTREAQSMLPRVTQLFSSIIPAIVQSYEHPVMKPYRQDQQYWVNQLPRITQAITSSDAFVQMDVLYCETRENLKAYLQLLTEYASKGKGPL